MKCKRCSSSSCILGGKVRGEQRYKCKGCGYYFVEGDKRKGKHVEKKEKAIKLYLEGMGFRAIGRFLEVSDVSVLRWVRSAGEKVKKYHEENKKTRPKEVNVIEMDEMHHYIGSKKRNVGFGSDSIGSKKL